MAQHPKIESLGSTGSIFLGLLQVRVGNGPRWSTCRPRPSSPQKFQSRGWSRYLIIEVFGPKSQSRYGL